VFGTPETVAWIAGHTASGRTVAAAIPPLFARYATFVEPDTEDDVALVEQERAVVRHLRTQGPHVWWLGYLDTGVNDVVFAGAPMVELYAGWRYVLVRGGPEQASGWRDALPDLMFPADRSWLVSMLWDDGWTCVGGPAALIDALAADPLVGARVVQLDEDTAKIIGEDTAPQRP
jgi:hypothetical protein